MMLIRLKTSDSFKATDIDNPSKVQNFQASWEACFPGVPFTKDILVAMIRGDQLPELEGINYEQLPGFIDDDPLRYEVTYEGVKYRHPYSLFTVRSLKDGGANCR